MKHSYINARCETGHLQARGEFTFKEGRGKNHDGGAARSRETCLKANFLLPCKVPVSSASPVPGRYPGIGGGKI